MCTQRRVRCTCRRWMSHREAPPLLSPPQSFRSKRCWRAMASSARMTCSRALELKTPAAAAGDPITEIESEEGAQAGTDTPTEDIVGQSTGKAETVGSSCSNESCIPTPGCRICFQGAEQVKSGRSFVPSALFIVGLCIYASHWRLWFLPGLCAIQNWTESEPFKCELNLNWGKTEIESECQEVHLLI